MSHSTEVFQPAGLHPHTPDASRCRPPRAGRWRGRLALLGAALAVALQFTPATTTAQSYPRDFQIGQQPSDRLSAAPGYLSSIRLDGPGTRIMRITDDSMGRGRIFRHEYALRQPWNADGSLLLMTQTPVHLLNGRSYAPIGNVDLPADAVWSDHDPDLLYGVRGNRLVVLSVSSNRLDTIERFDQYDGVFIGGGEGNLSTGDRRVALVGRYSGGVDVFVYDIPGRHIVSSRRFAGLSGPWGDIDSAAISPSGRYVLLGTNRQQRVWEQYDANNMNLVRRISPGHRSHGDMGYDTDGREVLVTQVNFSSALVSVRLDDGSVRQELPRAAMAWNLHVSCRNNLRPGWCYISTFAHPANREAYLYSQIAGVRLDGSGTIERFAPAAFADHPADQGYMRQAHAVPSRDGRQVLFASDWNQGQAGASIHAYVVSADPQ